MPSTPTTSDSLVRAESARGYHPLLDVRDLTVGFRPRSGESLQIVQDLSFSVHRGQATALVGESGSGKSVSMRALLRLLPANAIVGGSAVWEDKADPVELIGLPERQLRRVRGQRIGMVFQNASDSMNPTVTVRRQMTEHLLWHGICNRAEAERRAIQALGDVGIPEPERRMNMYPFQLSGGMRQRAMIAMAMVVRPALLIADEPTTAVDVTVQLQILDLLTELKRTGTAIIMITHDLGVARYFCDEVTVLYGGQVMEQAPIDQLLDDPKHPYTEGLLRSALELDDTNPMQSIPGAPPDLTERPDGCVFHPRCVHDEPPLCRRPQQLLTIGDGRRSRCWKATTYND